MWAPRRRPQNHFPLQGGPLHQRCSGNHRLRRLSHRRHTVFFLPNPRRWRRNSEVQLPTGIQKTTPVTAGRSAILKSNKLGRKKTTTRMGHKNTQKSGQKSSPAAAAPGYFGRFFFSGAFGAVIAVRNCSGVQGYAHHRRNQIWRGSISCSSSTSG